MATDTQFEAQRLVSISLTKMAQSRTQRTGVSLHKSLLVATVLQKARFLCMEEVFRMVHPAPQNFQQPQHQECYSYEDDDPLVGLTPEEAGINGNDFNDGSSSETSYKADDLSFDSYSSTQPFVRHESAEYCSQTSECDKENLAPSSPPADNPTYFDLDKVCRDQPYRDRCLYSNKALKRRRTICETEVEDTVQSIITKKTRVSNEDSVFLEDDDDEEEEEQIYRVHNCAEENESESKAMDIDRITSLVSIFSFGGMSNTSSLSDMTSSNANTSSCSSNSFGSLARSSSTPDLCSAQAKEADSMQQMPYLTMTV